MDVEAVAEGHESRSLRLVVPLLALGFAVLMATRGNDGDGRRFTAADLAGQLLCWRVWTERTPVPAQPTDETIYEFAPETYRVLTPALCAAFARAGADWRLYALARMLAFAGVLLLLYGLCRRQGFAAVAALLAMVLYAAALSGVRNHFRLRDAIHGVLLLASMWALLARRWWLWPMFLLAALNREDAALVPLLAALLLALGRRDRWYVRSLLGTGALLLAVRAAMLLVLGPRPYSALVWQLPYNLESFAVVLATGNVYHPLASRLAMEVPLVVAAVWGWRARPVLLKALVMVFLLYSVATMLVGRIQELEHQAFMLAFLVPGAVWGLFPGLYREPESEPQPPLPVEPSQADTAC